MYTKDPEVFVQHHNIFKCMISVLFSFYIHRDFNDDLFNYHFYQGDLTHVPKVQNSQCTLMSNCQGINSLKFPYCFLCIYFTLNLHF